MGGLRVPEVLVSGGSGGQELGSLAVWSVSEG